MKTNLLRKRGQEGEEKDEERDLLRKMRKVMEGKGKNLLRKRRKKEEG